MASRAFAIRRAISGELPLRVARDYGCRPPGRRGRSAWQTIQPLATVWLPEAKPLECGTLDRRFTAWTQAVGGKGLADAAQPNRTSGQDTLRSVPAFNAAGESGPPCGDPLGQSLAFTVARNPETSKFRP